MRGKIETKALHVYKNPESVNEYILSVVSNEIISVPVNNDLFGNLNCYQNSLENILMEAGEKYFKLHINAQ